MNADLRSVRNTLEAQLRESLSSKVLGDSIRIHQVADPLDMTQESAERDLAGEMLERESALARNIRSAIGRIQDGSYGICIECDEEIAPARLKAIPWAERCILCQEGAERLSSRRGTISENWKEAA
jgi:DnaK suppressor protein